jgi:glutathione synthase
MKIGFFVNRVATERDVYTTTGLAMEAHRRDHEVWYIGTDDFAYDPDGVIRLRGRKPEKGEAESRKAFLEGLQKDEAVERIAVTELDVLMLRNNPSEDSIERPWAQSVGILFGQLAADRGVLVLNDPNRLSQALNKMYMQLFPEEVRPKTLISRDPKEIRAFVKEHDGKAVLKPLQGSGGESVFVVSGDLSNLNQMIEAVQRFGYMIAQEYLPAAKEGDLRFLLLNGRPLERDGKFAAFRRAVGEDDVRSNMSVGGVAKKAEVGEEALRLAELVRPRLVQDGMFLVGLDIVGDKILEINVFSPGGLQSASELEETDFTADVIDAIERKVAITGQYEHHFDNVRIATL